MIKIHNIIAKSNTYEGESYFRVKNLISLNYLEMESYEKLSTVYTELLNGKVTVDIIECDPYDDNIRRVTLTIRNF